MPIERHTHNGADSLKINENDINNAIDKDTVVLLTTAQTIADVKTFSSIPVLPGSDPTTDNQAARKAYADAQIKQTEVIASDNSRDNTTTNRDTTNQTYTKLKEIEFNEVDGEIRTTITGIRVGVTDFAWMRLYVNGVAVGDEIELEAIDTTDTADISVETGDLIQVYGKGDDGVVTARIKGLNMKYDKVFTITPGTVNLS